MFFLQLLGKLVKALKSGESPTQMGWGFALGTMIGFMPVNTLLFPLLFLILFIVRINFASAMLAFAIYSIFAYPLDPVFHQIGYIVLVQVPFLKPLWTAVYNFPVAPLFRLNNTVVMGSFLTALLLLIPHFVLYRGFVIRYRESWNQKISKWKIVKLLKGSKLVRLYTRIKAYGG